MNNPLDTKGSGAPEAAQSRTSSRKSLRGPIRWLLALLSPILVLGLVEGVLRIVGFGWPTTYFVPGPTTGTWVENPAFGRRFFPAGLLRVPPPTRVNVRKEPGTTRILVIGESAAMGDPKPAFGVARYLEVLLRDRYPAGKFEVIPVAMTAVNSHGLLAMARECADLEADSWILFAGNNEVLGPFGAGSALGGRALSVGWVRCILAAKATRLGQAIEALAARASHRPVGSSRWAGLKVLAQESVPVNSPRRALVYESFERNLRDIVELGQGSGAKVIVSSVAVNLRDSGPFGTTVGSGLGGDDLAEVNRILEAGRRVMSQADLALDGAAIRRGIGLDPGHAGLQFLLGWVLASEASGPSVMDAFSRARDLDTLPLRADSRLNEILRRVAAETGVAWVDAEAALARESANGVPGREFFYEHVHLTPEGNHALARCFAEGLSGFLGERLRANAAADWASPEACATRLCLTPWARAASAELMLKRCLETPFTQRLNQESQVVHLAEEISRQRRAQTPQTAPFVAGLFTNAIAASPEDPHLRRVYAEFLEATGRLQEAVVQWRRVLDWQPHHPFAYLQAGSMLRRLGKWDEAGPLIERAVAMQPDWVEAHLELADLYLARRRPGDAVASCEAALLIQPDHARAHLRLADAQAANQQRDKALLSLQEAVRLDPRLWEARYLLGVEYAVAGSIEPAREQFEAVIGLKPDHALARLNLGIALARQGKWAEAAQQLSECLRLDPRNASAKQALEQVLAIQRQGESPTPP